MAHKDPDIIDNTAKFEDELNIHNRGNDLADARTPTRGWKKQHFHKVNCKYDVVDEQLDGYTFGVWGIARDHGDWTLFHLPRGRVVAGGNRKHGWTLRDMKRYAATVAKFWDDSGLVCTDVNGLEKIRLQPRYKPAEKMELEG